MRRLESELESIGDLAQKHLRRVRDLTRQREAVKQRWRDAIFEAAESGESYRVIEAYAGVSHEKIGQIVREERARRGG